MSRLVHSYWFFVAGFKVADRCDIKEFIVVFEWDPEATIVFLHELRHLLPSEIIPQRRLVRPVSGPLSFAPRVSNQAKSLSATVLKLDFFCTDQWVSVCIDQTHTFHIGWGEVCFLARGNSSAHGKLIFVGKKDRLPQSVLV